MAEKETVNEPTEMTPPATNEAELISPEELAKFNGWAGPSNGGESDPEVEAAARRLIAIENTAVIDPSEAPAPVPTPEPSPEPAREVTPEAVLEIPEGEEVATPEPAPVAAESRAAAEEFKRDRQERPGKVLRGAAAIGVTAGATFAGAEVLSNVVNNEPEFSRETTTYTLEEGDGLGDAAAKIQGIETIDRRKAVHYIEVDPANIDVLRDGLHPGETLTIPVSVVGHENDS